MSKEYLTVKDIVGPLLLADQVEGVTYGELVEIELSDGEVRRGRVLDINEDKALIRAFGVDGPLGIGVRRATFLIGADGIIRDSVLADLRIGRHAEFIRRAIVDAGGR